MPECPFEAVAMHAYAARKATELSIAKGDVVTVEGYAKKGWVAARSPAGTRGYVPQHFIAPAPPATDDAAPAPQPQPQVEERERTEPREAAAQAAAEAAQAAAAEALAAVEELRAELARREEAHARELAEVRAAHARDVDALRAALAALQAAPAAAPDDVAAVQRRVGELERAVREQVTLQHVAEKQLVRVAAQVDALHAECARALGAPPGDDAAAPGGLQDLTQ